MADANDPRELEELARVVQHTLDYGVILLDPEGRVLSWNDGAERIKGYRRDEIVGRHFSVFFTAEDVASHKPEYELKVAASEGRYEEDGWRVRKGGAPFWAHVVITPRRDETGGLVGFAKITQDVTARRHAEDALRAGEERYRVLVDSVKDYAIFLLDASGRVRTWNPGAQRIKGYVPSEIIGEHISRFYLPEDRARGRPQQLLAVAAKEGRVEDEGWRVRKDGTRFWADVVLTSIHNADGKLMGFSKVTRDLTERHASEAERVTLQREARERSEANRRLETFSYTVAHDLRAPIRGVRALADELAEDHAAALTPHARDVVEQIARTSDKMAALVEDLLNFSRASSVDVALEDVDLGKMAEHILRNTLQRRDPARAGELIVDEDLRVRGDAALLRIVMDNLLSNAWKFTGTKPRYRIEVRKRSGDGRDTILVKDNGVGFPPEREHELFEPFRRLHDASLFPGTGIGLSTVARIVERHGGRVWAEGHPGEGATVAFTLPRA